MSGRVVPLQFHGRRINSIECSILNSSDHHQRVIRALSP